MTPAFPELMGAHVVPLRALRLVDGQRMTVVELVGLAPDRIGEIALSAQRCVNIVAEDEGAAKPVRSRR
jgi:hypothetical protein